MSEINPFTPKETAQGQGESNVFLDLNKPDEATGVPAITPGLAGDAGGGGGGGSAFTPGSAESSKFNGQVILAGMVFAIGVGSIYAMRYIGMQAGIKESVSMVEYTASITTPDFVERFDEIMLALEESSLSVRFDENANLPSSPFTMAAQQSDEEVFVDNSVDPSIRMARLAKQRAEEARQQREMKILEYERLAMGLNLQSVIGGTRPVARISGKPVGIGMKVAGVFEVLSIKGSVVILKVDELKYELTLGSGAKRID